MSKQEIDLLTNKIKGLELQQANLTSEITKARKEVEGLSKAKPKGKREIIRGSGLYHGDKVVILNPSPKQETKGEVCGITKDGLIKVQPKEGKPIRRLPKNLKKQE